MHTLIVTLKRVRLNAFYPLLQQGVWVPSRVGVPLEELLVNQWGVDAGYVSSRITTIFVNSRAVDNVATTMVNGGGVVALSGAMPGLVGATMRRGGFYAAMRGTMTYSTDTGAGGCGIDRVRVKLFNLLLDELGPGFLSRGIIISAADIFSLITSGEFTGADFTVNPILNSVTLSVGELPAALDAMDDEELLLNVEFEEEP